MSQEDFSQNHLKTSSKPIEKKKNIILYLKKIHPKHIKAVRDLEQYTGEKFRIALLTDKKYEIEKEAEKDLDIVIRTNVKRFDLVEDSLLPYHDQIVAITAKYENAMPLFAKLTHIFPYLRNPDAKSLEIASDKYEMRKAFKKYAPHTIPKFIHVKNADEETIKAIEKIIKYPCVVKPANLSKSILVHTCYYREELKKTLEETFKKAQSLYKTNKVEQKPKLIVEELLEGKMYSVDAYVNSRGKIYFTPFISITTGKDKGYDDFFMHTLICPATLNQKKLEEAQKAVEDGIHALGLRSSTAHVEMYETEKGFKLVEIGARTGGYRDELLGDTLGIPHHMNDLLIHLGKAPVIKKTKNRWAAMMRFYPRKTGVLKKFKGFKKISEEPFVTRYKQFKFPGDKVGPAKLGYGYIAYIYLIADSREELMGHIRKTEKTVETILE